MADEPEQTNNDTFKVDRAMGDLGDADRQRKPITLDGSVGLDDALAAARAMRPEPAQQDEDEPARSYDLSTPEIEAPAGADAPQIAAPVVDNRDDRIAKLEDEVKATNNLYLRAVADLQNFRRRGEEERLRLVKEGNERLIKNLLPVLDDFDLALTHAKKADSLEQVISGVEAIQRKFQDLLSKEGVEPIVALGEKFDPDYHEAVAIDAESEAEDETVIDELRRGYSFHGRVLRPASVRVAKNA